MIFSFLNAPRRYLGNVYRRQIRRESFAAAIQRDHSSLRCDIPDLPKITCRPKIIFLHDTGYTHDVEYRREGNKIVVTLDWEYARIETANLWEHIVAHYYWYANCDSDIGPITINIGDGDAPSAAKVGQCSFLDDVVLLPDMHFHRNRGYLRAGKTFAESNLTWAERSDEIVWRGSVFGCGYVTFETALAKHPAVLQRIRLAHLAKGSEVDFKFIEYFLSKPWHAIMNRDGFVGERVPEYSWVNRKYAIDIDGFSNAWGNFYIRLKLGCCVFKVDSEFGYRQWYYDKLEPYKHFIPVKADLSDLFSQIAWAKTHQKEAEKIANTGRLLADSMDFKSETLEAVHRLTAYSGNS